jgi:hypothetical protein
LRPLSFHKFISTYAPPQLCPVQSVGHLLKNTCRLTSILVLGALLLPTAGISSTETSSLLSGHWHAAETANEKKERLRTIDELTRHQSGFQRDMIHSRLVERTSPPRSLLIEIEGVKVTIASENGRVELELGGPPIYISGSQGKAQMMATMQGPLLLVMARSDNGKRTTTYRANENLLTMEVKMTSTRLPGALNYVVSYVRTQ